MSDTSTSGDSSSSKSLMWMMLALFAGLGVMLGGGLFLANGLLHSMGMAAAGTNKNTLRTPMGSFRLEKQDQVGPGMPVYPRASLRLPGTDNAGAAIQQAQDGITTVTYQTQDDRDAVSNWYGEHLSPEFTRHDSTERPLPEPYGAVPVSDGDITFLAERGGNLRAVTLAADPAGTKICMIQMHAHTTPAATPAANP
jgi:hypothetical protein